MTKKASLGEEAAELEKHYQGYKKGEGRCSFASSVTRYLNPTGMKEACPLPKGGEFNGKKGEN